jgi:arsenate reductase (glutaredoxin)
MASRYRIYHNPRCTKSRQTLALLIDAGITPEILLYLETPPNPKELSSLIKQLGFSSPRQLLRTGEEIYKQLKLNDPSISDNHIIDAMVNHPKLIERPIVVKGHQAIIGRPPESVLTLIG